MSVEKAVEERAVRAKMASRQLVHHSSEQRSVALCRAAELLGMRRSKIMRANAIDLEGAQSKALSAAMIDRLTITDARIEDMANGLREVAAQDDPVGRVLEEWTRPNGLQIQKVSVPLGVVGIIYESRPNVTIDAAGLCLKSGNACLLRGGSEAINSNLALAAVMQEGLVDSGLPESA
ncbi:MAG TPA: aldehyde dehydrogenase family protein, partial [Armatimonadota bacterium]|nr:aldehyde dehydrogenase family protein [Armatimonadota bacterium]